MIEFQEFPKALYHPDTNDMAIVRDAEQEADKLAEWGVDAPKLELKSAGNDGEGATKAKAATPKAFGATKAKAAN